MRHYTYCYLLPTYSDNYVLKINIFPKKETRTLAQQEPIT